MNVISLKREVSGEGPTGGILIVGEAPGADEVIQGKPFVGRSGQILRKYCQQVGMDRVRFENVVEYKLERNDETVLYRDPRTRLLATEELLAWRADLKERIALIKPTAIVLCGDTALKALTDHTSISRVHCYVLRDSLYTDAPIIPAYHPAYILRQRSNSFWLKFALQKALEVSLGKDDPDFSVLINNNALQAYAFLQKCLKSPEVCIDIETIKGKDIITAIGFSYNSNEALSVSRIGEDKVTDVQWTVIMKLTKQIMENPNITKIGQNFLFDALMLNRIYDIGLKGPVWDTMHAANCIYSDLKKSLEEQGRLWTYRAPWKGGWNSTGEKLRLYNAQDIIITHRIKEKQEAEMKRLGILEHFQTPKAIFLPAYDLCKRGIKIDTVLKTKLKKDVEEALKEPHDKVVKWAATYLPPGERKKKKRDPEKDRLIFINEKFNTKGLKRSELNEALHKRMGIPLKECPWYYFAKNKDTKHGLKEGLLYQKAYRYEITLYKRTFNPKSPAQTEAVLRNANVKIPKTKQQHTKKWAESTNEKALKKILTRGKDPQPVLDFVNNMLILREGNKLISSYCDAELDSDNRWRCHYNVEGAETGRSATRKTSWGTGGNNQNIPRDGFRGVKFKNCFIADAGYTLFQSDQAQAEARVVAYLSHSEKLINLLEEGEDIHVYAINSILGDDIRGKPNYKYLRQCGKFINHGGNYDMGPVTLVEQASLVGVDIPLEKADFFLKERKKVFPEIYEWHESIRAQLHKDRTLWTPFGRRRKFFGMLNDETYRKAYAHIPQSTIPHITNLMWLWIEQNEKIKDYVKVLQMGHDSLLMQIYDYDDLGDDFIHGFIYHASTLKFQIHGQDINIPWDAAVGSRWGELKQWKGI